MESGELRWPPENMDTEEDEEDLFLEQCIPPANIADWGDDEELGEEASVLLSPDTGLTLIGRWDAVRKRREGKTRAVSGSVLPCPEPPERCLLQTSSRMRSETTPPRCRPAALRPPTDARAPRRREPARTRTRKRKRTRTSRSAEKAGAGPGRSTLGFRFPFPPILSARA